MNVARRADETRPSRSAGDFGIAVAGIHFEGTPRIHGGVA